MLKLIKNSFKMTNDCIILATPLIIFLSLFGWYFDYAVSTVDNVYKLILAGTTLLVMASGLISAWLYMAKKTIALSKKVFIFDKDRAKALWNLLASLPKGIGKLFLPFIGVIAIYLLIYLLMFSGIDAIISKIAGSINLDSFNFQTIMISSKELINEVNELTDDEIIIINYWYLLTIIGSSIISFITMLWIPEIVYNEKNCFKALFNSIKKVFIDFKNSIILFVYITAIVLFLTILNTILMFYPVLYFFVLLLYYYFVVYIIVLLFTYYETTYIKA